MSKKRRIDTWQYFLLKYLIINQDIYLETRFMFYNASRPFLGYANFVNYIISILKKCGVKQFKSGIDIEIDANDYEAVAKKIKSTQPNLFQKAKSQKLSIDDLYKLVNDNKSSFTDEVYKNLAYTINWSQDAITNLKGILNDYIESYMKEEVERTLLYYYRQVYSYGYQKEMFLKNLPDYVKKYGAQLNLTEQEDAVMLGEDPKQIDFLETLLALEYEGYINILDLESHLHDEWENKEKDKDDVVVVMTLGEKLSQPSSIPVKIPLSPPVGWNLTHEGRELHICKSGQVVFSFKQYSSKKCRYFRCLWENYGQKKSYQEIFEYDTSEKYPGIKKAYQTNDDIRNAMRKLQKEFQAKQLPIFIYTDVGLTLTIKN